MNVPQGLLVPALRQRLEGTRRVGSPGRMLPTALSRLDVEACGVAMRGRVQIVSIKLRSTWASIDPQTGRTGLKAILH